MLSLTWTSPHHVWLTLQPPAVLPVIHTVSPWIVTLLQPSVMVSEPAPKQNDGTGGGAGLHGAGWHTWAGWQGGGGTGWHTGAVTHISVRDSSTSRFMGSPEVRVASRMSTH